MKQGLSQIQCTYKLYVCIFFLFRFDWKGVLLPYQIPTDVNADRELYLHGDDAARPGYTLQELFRLARLVFIPSIIINIQLIIPNVDRI